MRTRLAAACVVLASVVATAQAHRLDEYLQATTISIEKDRVQAQIRLIPGVAVFPVVLAGIDNDRDGVVSAAEQRTYADRVHQDLSLTIDDRQLQLRLISSAFPPIEALKQGLGEIELQFDADVPEGGSSRKLVFENRHQTAIATYLVNSLVPADPQIRVTAQNRNYQQSLYELEYVQADTQSSAQSGAWWSDSWQWWVIAALLLIAGAGLLPRHLKALRLRRPRGS